MCGPSRSHPVVDMQGGAAASFVWRFQERAVHQTSALSNPLQLGPSPSQLPPVVVTLGTLKKSREESPTNRTHSDPLAPHMSIVRGVTVNSGQFALVLSVVLNFGEVHMLSCYGMAFNIQKLIDYNSC